MKRTYENFWKYKILLLGLELTIITIFYNIEKNYLVAWSFWYFTTNETIWTFKLLKENAKGEW